MGVLPISEAAGAAVSTALPTPELPSVSAQQGAGEFRDDNPSLVLGGVGGQDVLRWVAIETAPRL